jgi:multidrug efflux pump subunit AcrB
MRGVDHIMGLTGRFTEYFITSKLTPLIMVMTVTMGALAIWVTPKEDEPSITLTVADVLLTYPGRGAQDIDERLSRPVGSWIREIPTVKHVVSSAGEHAVLFTVEFREGVPREKALTQLYDRLYANMDQLPPGVSVPLVKPRGVAEVPSLAVSLWSQNEGPQILRKIASEMAAELRRIPNVSRVDIIGGQSRSFLVELDARRLAERGIAADRVIQAVQSANFRVPAGAISGQEGVLNIEAGAFLQSASDTGVLIVGANAAGPIYLRDVANVRDGVADTNDYVSRMGKDTGWSGYPAVTLAVTKVDSSNVTVVTREARRVLDKLAKELLPGTVHMSVTRDVGEKAEHTLSEVNKHMIITILVSIFLIVFTLGWRAGIITAVALPVTIIFVPIIYNLTGFTLNRIALASIVFAIGLLIDDSIVVIESIHRHWHSSDAKSAPLVVAYAVQEVGPPTILATLMVICALLPTAFLTGMSGQYLRVLPVGACLGMLFSLFVAFTVTPYLCLRIFPSSSAQGNQVGHVPGSGHKYHLISYYRSSLAWFMDRPKRMFKAYVLVVILFVTMVAMIQARIAIVRAMPYDNAEEVSIMIDLPPATQLEDAYAKVMDAAQRLKTIPEVTACNVYVGTSAPVTFQGLARHYDFRKEPFQAEIQVQLLPNVARARRSHEIALDMRPFIAPLLSGKDTVFVVAEPPPAVPTLAPLVAEVYGPDDDTRLALAGRVKSRFTTMPGVVDVDWTARPGTERIRYEVDHQKSSVQGVVAAQAASTVRTLFAGDSSSWANLPHEREPVPIIVRLARPGRSSTADIRSLSFTSLTGGPPVPAMEIGSMKRVAGPYPILRKDLEPVVMVTGVVTGDGPNYSAADITKLLKKETVGGQALQVIWSDEKSETGSYAVSWAGEWSIQRDLFSDLGVSFLVVLFLIYCFLVAWYRSFLIPVIIMLPIPLVIIGVIPAHIALDKPLDGPGTMGVIALAGIVIRNSILLVDFARSRIASGMPIKDAILQACETRLRPIILTALAVILGEAVLYFDPILRGLGITMPSGALISTLLTLGIVPLAFYQLSIFLQARGHELVSEREPERI